MPRIALITPGSTNFDEQGRIMGTLDVPLSEQGEEQVDRLTSELRQRGVEVVYCCPCQSSEETAGAIARQLGIRARTLDRLTNVNQGLWQGKKISEVRQSQPKVYKRWQANPEEICPPEGETLSKVRDRISGALKKLLRKHKGDTIALVAPEPLFSVVRSSLTHNKIGDLWEAECEHGGWELIEVEPAALPG